MKKMVLILLLFIPSFISCHIEHEKEIKLFWKYIQENEKQIFELTNAEIPLWYEIYNHIQSVDNNIYVMLENDFNEKRNLIITCNGKYDYFDLCDQIVKFAPNLEYLVPVSLFPSLDKIEPFIFGDFVLTVDDVKVEYYEEVEYSSGRVVNRCPKLFANYPNELYLRIHEIFEESKNFDEFHYIDSIYRQMVEIMAQQIIGERLFGEKIKNIETTFPEQAQNAFPIKNLKNYFSKAQ
jgi:hypothetical protein